MDRFKRVVFKDKDITEVLFKILRIILSFTNCIIIISSVVLMFTGEDLGEPELIQNHKIVVYVCIILLLAGIGGLVGTILEHLGLLIAYAFLWSIVVIIKAAELRRDNCLSFIISLSLCVATAMYVALIKYLDNLDDKIMMTRKFSRKIAG